MWMKKSRSEYVTIVTSFNTKIIERRSIEWELQFHPAMEKKVLWIMFVVPKKKAERTQFQT